MTPEAQRICIAEACGWKFDNSIVDGAGWFHPTMTGDLPDYLNDLNAMQVAVMSQGWGDSEETDFEMALSDICDSHRQDHFATVTATATQRAEAFLKTIGKWVETPELKTA